MKSLVLSLRRMMMGSRSSGRPRLRVLLALTLVMAIQAVALTHLVGHAARGDNGGCAICATASQAGHAIPPSPVHIDFLNLAVRPASPVVTGQLYRSAPTVYRSRAPPVSA